MKDSILKHAALNAVGAAAYIAAVASFLFYVPKTFLEDKADTVLLPMFMISLLVFSAALMAVLVFGRPVLWYLDGKKKEAVALLGYTMGVFLALMALSFAGLLLTR